jgi:hypothetical protein
MLGLASTKKLLKGKSVGVDAMTLEADAAMKSIVRKDTGEDWKEYLTRLMKEEGEPECLLRLGSIHAPMHAAEI